MRRIAARDSRELGDTAGDSGRSTIHGRQSTPSAQGPAGERGRQALCHGLLDRAAEVRSPMRWRASTRKRTRQRWRERIAPNGCRW
eukprot:642630-Pleurochrysis_carterae.AAC.2